MVAKIKVNMQVPQSDNGQSRIVLSLLDAIAQDGVQSQREMADRFGIALGLVNAQLRICVQKGYVEVEAQSRRRYAYRLTPKGVAEKARLMLQSMATGLDIFRRARGEYRAACGKALRGGWRRVVLVGASELAEIAVICALETDIKIVAVVDPAVAAERFAGAPVLATLKDVVTPFDGALITDVREPETAYAGAVAILGSDGVIVPEFFGLAPAQERAA
jgi:DNA-binding MarR family transcriptional regulator